MSQDPTDGRRGPDRDLPQAMAAEEPPPPPGELEARLAATEDRLLRALADLDNHRKRFAREVERSQADARERILRDWLEVADTADRASAAFADRQGDPVLEGLAAVADQVAEVLRRQGAERLDALGAPFDPERHEAVGTVPTQGAPEGSVVAVTRPGYTLGGRLLRPAQVLVARRTGPGA